MISLKLKNQRLKKIFKKYKDFVKCLKQNNQASLERISKIGDKRDNLMVKFTKVFRFNQKLKKNNGNLLRKKRYWKKEYIQERKKHYFLIMTSLAP